MNLPTKRDKPARCAGETAAVPQCTGHGPRPYLLAGLLGGVSIKPLPDPARGQAGA
ncbi:MAG: hypothetical protein NTV55_12810 [Planctomycetota bacterium]|nr:hypothetical protein [Planctomycetota bacterium]